MTTLDINGKSYTVNLPDDTPLLWVLRDEIGLTGTKFGCGMALCGACTVHDRRPAGARVPDADRQRRRQQGHDDRGRRAATRSARAVQAAWVDLGVPQCGYCQAGQIMSATALLKRNAKPSDADIDAAMDRQHLPLRHVRAHPRRHQAGRAGRARMSPPLDAPSAATRPIRTTIR